MNGNLYIFAGLSILTFGIYYYYSHRDPELQVQINANKSVKYTNIDNLITTSKNLEYLSLNENNINNNINKNNSSMFSSNMSEDNNLKIKEDDKPNNRGGFFSNKYY